MRRKFRRRSGKKNLMIISILLLLPLLFIAWANYRIISYSRPYIYSDSNQLKETGVALLLGTSRYAPGGGENLYFRNRIDAASELFKKGVISNILVSGDNGQVEYNEPREMRRALEEAGVPDSAVTLDYAGFRTYDSVIRAKKVFGQKRLIIISQRFHLQRALYIARKNGMEAVGFEAGAVPSSYSYMTNFRELFAKVQALLDVHLIKPDPRFLGDPVIIEDETPVL